MTKTEFMDALYMALSGVEEGARLEIMSDFEEHFTAGAAEGKTDDEISDELGSPEDIAAQFRSDLGVPPAAFPGADEQAAPPPPVGVPRIVFTAFGLFFLNAVFVVGPYLGVWGAYIGVCGAVFGIGVAGLAGILSVILSPILGDFFYIGDGVFALGAVLTFIGLASLSALLAPLCIKLGRLFVSVTAKYLRFNLDIITGKRRSL